MTTREQGINFRRGKRSFKSIYAFPLVFPFELHDYSVK